MSGALRQSTLKQVARRKISFAVAQNGSQATLSGGVDIETSSVDTSKNTRGMTVGEYVQSLNQPYILSSDIQRKLRTEIASPESNSIRTLLLANDVRGFNNKISNITAVRDFQELHGLSSQERSILLNRLTTSQVQDLKRLEASRYPLVKSQTKSEYLELSFRSKQIYQVAKHLISKKSLAISDAESVLKMLLLNQKLAEASILIHSLEKHHPNIRSVTYQNIRLEIMGKTSPELYSKPKRKALNSTKFKYEQDWNKLLSNFLNMSSDFTPNLQSHKILISGLAKYHNLDQVKSHVNTVWGINSESEPTSLVPRTSSLYPDTELLEILASAYGINGDFTGIFPLLAKFEKYYTFDMVNNVHIWRVLLENIKLHIDKESRYQVFTNVWNLMKAKKVNLNTRLYSYRLTFLKEADKIDELIDDLPLIQKLYFNQYSQLESRRVEKLMTSYLQHVIGVVYAQDLESDDKVLMLIDKYGLNSNTKKYIIGKLDKIKDSVAGEQRQFVELQRQYDQEEDEDSLW